MKIDVLVDAAAFCERLAADLAAASERAWVQTLSFEGDTAGTWLADAMLACAAKDRRILVDSYTRWFLSDRFIYRPRNLADAGLRAETRATSAMIERLRDGGVDVRFVAPMGLLLRRLPARDHKKMVVLDDRVAYIGGINFSDHNFAWHDLMLRIEDGGVAGFLGDDFRRTAGGGGPAQRATFGGLELMALDGASNERMLEDVLALVRRAERSVIVHSAYVTFPFTDALRAAAARGARVTIVTPAVNNRGFLQDYMLFERLRSGFDVRLYPDRMSHLKAVLVDDRWLIAGSLNFDWLTYGYQPEVVAVITEPDVIASFRRQVLEPDLSSCTPADGRGNIARGRLADRVMRMVARAARMTCGRERRDHQDGQQAAAARP